mmetsp:Transcript_9174/g.22496  ORF Transcript_9174/g.22496 Transcript_9174/m.22496 type:complete len:246 (+) Transcript_9174:875-1612(+)
MTLYVIFMMMIFGVPTLIVPGSTSCSCTSSRRRSAAGSTENYSLHQPLLAARAPVQTRPPYCERRMRPYKQRAHRPALRHAHWTRKPRHALPRTGVLDVVAGALVRKNFHLSQRGQVQFLLRAHVEKGDGAERRKPGAGRQQRDRIDGNPASERIHENQNLFLSRFQANLLRVELGDDNVRRDLRYRVDGSSARAAVNQNIPLDPIAWQSLLEGKDGDWSVMWCAAACGRQSCTPHSRCLFKSWK